MEEALMAEANRQEQVNALRKKSHMPEHSVLFEKIIPILLIGMGILMAALILFAAGVLLGIVHF
jgi:hypothetical protein